MVSGERGAVCVHIRKGAAEPVRGKEVMAVRSRLDGCRAGLLCPCTAMSRDGSEPCGKCARRARWSRRKARRGYGDALC